MSPDRTLLTAKQAADFLGKSMEVFQYYLTNGRGPDYILIGKRRYYTEESLLLWQPKDRRKLNKKPSPQQQVEKKLLARIAALQTKVHELQTKGDQE